MVKEFSLGQIVKAIKAIIRKTESMGKVYLLGKMEVFMMGNGKMEFSMERENILISMELSKKEFGKMEIEKVSERSIYIHI